MTHPEVLGGTDLWQCAECRVFKTSFFLITFLMKLILLHSEFLLIYNRKLQKNNNHEGWDRNESKGEI